MRYVMFWIVVLVLWGLVLDCTAANIGSCEAACKSQGGMESYVSGAGCDTATCRCRGSR